MLALLSAWLGLAVSVLAIVMVFWRGAFTDVTVPIALYGAVVAIGCGGLALMRRIQPGDRPEHAPAQRLQAKVGIGLGMFTVIVVYALMALAHQVQRVSP